MIFKKKYKKSEWMEGLLLAEKWIQSGYDIDEVKSLYLTGRSCGKSGIVYYSWYRESYIDFVIGMSEYIKYFEENKEILSKGLDG